MRTKDSTRLAVGCLVATFLSSGCATLFDSRKGQYEGATLVDNPLVTGKVAKDVDATGAGGRSEVRMHSFDKASGGICFVVRTPNPDAMKEVDLVAYGTSAEFETREPGIGGEKVGKVRVQSSFQNTETYQSTETSTLRDSRGQVIATEERPVTKVQVITYYDLEACYPGKVLTDKTGYLGLEAIQSSLFGTVSTVVAAWRFQNDISTH